MQRTRRALALGTAFCAGVALPALLPLPAAAEECTPHPIDVGTDTPVMGGCEPLRIAFMIAATNNTHLQAQIKGAQDAAAEIGAELAVFDPNWSPTTQFNQAQNIISGGQFNAILAEMNDGNQACSILTKTAPEAGVLVAVVNQPVCGRGSNEGDELWAPGTLNFVGGTQGRTAFRDWIFSVAEENPGPQKVAVLTGPDLNSNTINTDLAVKDVQEAYPDFKVIATVRTDYSVLQGNEKTLPLFQANKDLNIFISNYSDMTRGAVQAAKQVGITDSLKIYDSGGNKWAFEAVRRGEIARTRTIEPYAETYTAIKQIGEAWKGQQVARFTLTDTLVVTPENVADHEAEY
ncbi:sugar ABC transporter substrate-binding protein [Xinfangfangia sp. D13-10-4-6]|uniref:sugar ABC transporter substrate-binding protein n=1 Tax=Pseudogemmobacter hezensis TaxID=2737662 RepID=UPI001553319C|nr:sugar ABC transporter substrate-binding protein [Pseudogemmobacter hezensis]NPD14893.1 sugar ABC transporter substrate-binding protein [Pseudogemmobacter hezensis]